MALVINEGSFPTQKLKYKLKMKWRRNFKFHFYFSLFYYLSCLLIRKKMKWLPTKTKKDFEETQTTRTFSELKVSKTEWVGELC